jgi:hypothetical protein
MHNLAESEERTLEKFKKHAMNLEIKGYMGMGGASVLMDLPICPRCENIALRDKGWAAEGTIYCPVCGNRSSQRISLGDFIQQKLFK